MFFEDVLLDKSYSSNAVIKSLHFLKGSLLKATNSTV